VRKASISLEVAKACRKPSRVQLSTSSTHIPFVNDLNPYQSSTTVEPTPPARPILDGYWRMFPTLWALLLFFGLPAVQVIPLYLRIGSTIVTAAAILTVALSTRGWGHLRWGILYAALVVLQRFVWLFPF
jgi:hypothetical protein